MTDDSAEDSDDTEDRSPRFAEFVSEFERSRSDASSADDQDDDFGPVSPEAPQVDDSDFLRGSTASDRGNDAPTSDSSPKQPTASDPSSRSDTPQEGDDIDSWEWLEDDADAEDTQKTDPTFADSADGSHPSETTTSSGHDNSLDTSPKSESRVWGSDPGETDRTSPRSEAESPSETETEEVAGSRIASESDDGTTDSHTETPSSRSSPSESNQKSSSTGKQAEGRSRLWSDSGQSTGDAFDVRSSGSTGGAQQPPATQTNEFTQELAASDEYHRPAGLTVQPGSSILVQCGAQDDRKHQACFDMLDLEQAAQPHDVLLVRYRKLGQSRMERIVKHAARVKIISIGHSQPIPDALRDEVESVKINNPSDTTRLGIVVSGTVEDWESSNRETVVCFDSLNVLFEYKDIKNAFRLLHIFIGMLQGADTISHFHADPLAGDSQNVNTVKPLFDDVLSVDSIGIDLE